MKIKSTIILFFTIGMTVFAQTKGVDGEAIGLYFNTVSEKMTAKPIIVYVDAEQNIYIRGGDGLRKATCYILGRRLKEVVALLEKSIEWSKISQQKKLEVKKPLGSFYTGEKHEKQGIEMIFSSADKGQSSCVTLNIQDFDNMFTNVTLYVEPEQVLKLIAILKKAPETYRALKAQQANADLLK